MLVNLVFSKDRPMQLQGYLKSLEYCTELDPRQTIIFCDYIDKYINHIDTEIDILNTDNFIEDRGSFKKTIISTLENLHKNNKYILFGCDDCVWIRQVHIHNAIEALEKRPDILGFSLRLGNNILGAVALIINSSIELGIWNYKRSHGHYGYPIDLMGSIYRISDILQALYECDSEVKSPNYLESYLTNYYLKSDKYTLMSCFNSPNYLVAQDCNRVQNDFPNKFTGSEDQNQDRLLEDYKNGLRLNWKKTLNIMPSDVFVGNKYFYKIPKEAYV